MVPGEIPGRTFLDSSHETPAGSFGANTDRLSPADRIHLLKLIIRLSLCGVLIGTSAAAAREVMHRETRICGAQEIGK
jgi:hypothetical protein